MKLPLTIISFLLVFSAFGKESPDNVQAAVDSRNFECLWVTDDTIHPNLKDVSLREGPFNTFLVGPRINYTHGKYGFLGCSGAFMWHEVGYIFESHIGFSAGMDFRLSKSTVYVPKVTVEYRYLIGVVRVGYSYFTDFKSAFEHRFSSEIGFSVFGFLDITYMHSFGSKRNPFDLESGYLNITATIPLNL